MTFPVQKGKKPKTITMKILSMGTGCPQRLQNLHSWGLSRAKTKDLQSPFQAKRVLWLYEMPNDEPKNAGCKLLRIWCRAKTSCKSSEISYLLFSKARNAFSFKCHKHAYLNYFCLFAFVSLLGF